MRGRQGGGGGAIAIRDHHVFDGRLDQKTLSLTERISLMGRRTG
jgi:hypothetical protein